MKKHTQRGEAFALFILVKAILIVSVAISMKIHDPFEAESSNPSCFGVAGESPVPCNGPEEIDESDHILYQMGENPKTK